MKFKFIALFLLLASFEAFGATYYLNSTVGPGGDGSESSPYDAFSDITIAASDTVYCTGTFKEQISLTSIDNVSIIPYGTGCVIDGENTRDYGILADRTSNLTIGTVEIKSALKNGIKVFVDTASTTDSGIDIAAVVHDVLTGDSTPANEAELEIGTCILVRTGPTTGTSVLNDVDLSDAVTYNCGKHGIDIRWRVTNVIGEDIVSYRNGSLVPGHGVSTHPMYINIATWTLVSGNVYTRDRLSSADNEQRMINATDSVALAKNTSTPTTPGSNEWGVVAAGAGGACTNNVSTGCLYVNIGGSLAGKTFTLKRHPHGPFNFKRLESYRNIESTPGNAEGHGLSADDLSGPLTCEECYFHDNEGAGGKTLNGESIKFLNSISARNRIGFECTRGNGFEVLNSVASESEAQGIWDQGSTCLSTVLKNSVASQNGTAGEANGISFSAGTASGLTQATNFAYGNSATGQCSNATCTNSDPKFIGGDRPTTKYGFIPKSDSALCRAGTSIDNNLDPSVGAFDCNEIYNLDTSTTRTKILTRE